jgi:hypothetical protein
MILPAIKKKRICFWMRNLGKIQKFMIKNRYNYRQNALNMKKYLLRLLSLMVCFLRKNYWNYQEKMMNYSLM